MKKYRSGSKELSENETVQDEGNGGEKFFLMQFTCPFSLHLKVPCPLEFNKARLHCSLASDESFSLLKMNGKRADKMKSADRPSRQLGRGWEKRKKENSFSSVSGLWWSIGAKLMLNVGKG